MRQNILDKLRTDLAAITTGNGYNYTINKVYRERKSIDEVNHNELPATFLQPLMERSLKTSDYLLENKWQIGLVYILKCAKDTDDSGTREETVEKVITDIRGKVYSRTSQIYTLDLESLIVSEVDSYDLSDDLILVTFIIDVVYYE